MPEDNSKFVREHNGRTLAAMPTQMVTADIVRLGDKILIPEEMDYADAIRTIKERAEYENKVTQMSTTIDVHPFDGANALVTVLSNIYGWAQGIPTPGFFGDEPPQMIDVEVGVGKTKLIPWGRFEVPNVKGFIQTHVTNKNGRVMFAITAEIVRRDEPTVRRIFDAVTAELKGNSIYKGKALKIRFKGDDGDVMSMPDIKFMTADLGPENLIFSQTLMRMVTTNLFTPISRAQECLENGIPIKRGVLLGGPYGTGKTLAATAAAKLAVEAGITYIYIPRADELSMAIQFAQQYQSPACVVFCEDIDRVVAGERSVAMDDILNIIDGIDSKRSHTIVVLTTNHMELINPAMLRPGRLDAVIEVTAPDAEAVQKLVRLYGGSLVEGADLAPVAALLEGQIPAVIAEVVKRAKLAQMTYQPKGEPITKLTSDALVDAAHTIKGQTELLKRAMTPPDAAPTIDGLMRAAMDDVVSGRVPTAHDNAKMVLRAVNK